MTIRKRLWLSHVISLIIPLLMTLVITAISLLGLFYFIIRGNFIYVESQAQYNMSYNVIQYAAFRDMRHDEKLNWIIYSARLFSPQITYIAIHKDGTPLYFYGNQALAAHIPTSTYTNTTQTLSYGDDARFFTISSQIIKNHIYRLTFITEPPVTADDKKVESLASILLYAIFFALILMIWIIGRFLTRFTMRRILDPLQALAAGAREVEQGNLNVHVTSHGNDEFTPIIKRFNAMAQSLKESADSREAEEQSRRELIAGISHDLRTPLTSIKAYVEGLLDGIAPTPEAQHKYLHIIQSKTNTLDVLLEQLFLFSKLDLGTEALHPEPIHLHRFFQEYVYDNAEQYAARGLTIKLHINNRAVVLGDEAIFLRIIENLLTNSVKYKEAKMGHCRITLGTSGNNAVITVTDDGPGVPPEAIKRLFEAFYRTDKARSKTYEGTGLGLAIAAKYIALMKGNIQASSAIPQGLQITITLPLFSTDKGAEHDE